MQKKAQGLSLNTIIIAIIVLVVLVVLILIFTGYIGTRFTPGVTKCENSGGACQFPDTTDGSSGCGFTSFGNEIEQLGGSCPNPEQVCCTSGLGSGQQFTGDNPLCGEEGQAPCRGNQCNSGLEIADGKCATPLPACTGQCLAVGTNCQSISGMKQSPVKTKCSGTAGVCCVPV